MSHATHKTPKRYIPELYDVGSPLGPYAGMEEEDNGEYMLYEDHENMVAAFKADARRYRILMRYYVAILLNGELELRITSGPRGMSVDEIDAAIDELGEQHPPYPFGATIQM